jgi:hypothetical protein
MKRGRPAEKPKGEPPVHYVEFYNEQHPELNKTICGKTAKNHIKETTTDIDEVTCLQCLKWYAHHYK